MNSPSTTGGDVAVQDHPLTATDIARINESGDEDAHAYITMRPGDCPDCLADSGFRRCAECKRLFAFSATSSDTCSVCVINLSDTREIEVPLADIPKMEAAVQSRMNKEVRSFAKRHGFTSKMQDGQRIIRLIGGGYATKTTLYTWVAVAPRKRGRPGKVKAAGLKVEMVEKAVRVTGQEALMARFLAERRTGFCPRLNGSAEALATGRDPAHSDQAGVDGNRRPGPEPLNGHPGPEVASRGAR